MKVEDLLLNADEIKSLSLTARGCTVQLVSGLCIKHRLSFDICQKAERERLCEAQAAKVLAALQHTGRTGYATNQFLQDIVAEAGLTWPPKEG